jgi:hypothetical protein
MGTNTKKIQGETMAVTGGEGTTAPTVYTMSMDIEKSREFIVSNWYLGKDIGYGGLLNAFWVVLVSAMFLYFGTGMLRGFVPNPISFGVGVGFLRTAITYATFSVQKGLIDPFLVLLGLLIGRVTWKYASVIFFAQLLASATAFGVIHALNPGGGFVINDGAPTVVTHINYLPLAMAFEMMGSGACYFIVLYCFGLKEVHGFYKRLAKSENFNGHKDWRYYSTVMKSQSPKKLGGSISIGFVNGAMSLIGFYLTGASFDFFMFIWPALYSGLIMNYAPWWVYLAGPALGFVGAMIFYNVSLRTAHLSYETLKLRGIEKMKWIVKTFKLEEMDKEVIVVNDR